MPQEFHLPDRELLMAADGELSTRELERVEAHLAACWACRARKQELEGAIGEFIRVQRASFDNLVPVSDGPRALLKAHLGQLAGRDGGPRLPWHRWIASRLNRVAMTVAAALLLAAGGALVFRAVEPRPVVAVTVPNPSVTPGATVLVSEREVCREAAVKNKIVPVALQRIVFAEYGIASAEPGAYEVDYLITPALGGADDIHNLWPESRRATAWNAQVKDTLEDHLHDLVCEGRLDLATAQRELAGNWIEAYKKYFHTNRPLAEVR